MNWFNTLKKISPLLLLLSVVVLSLVSASGVYLSLLPTRGWAVALCAAIGFEIVYIAGSTVAITRSDIREKAVGLNVATLVVVCVLNWITEYQILVSGGMNNVQTFLASFDVILFLRSLLYAVPMAIIAFVQTNLLHAISDETATDTDMNAVITELNSTINGLNAKLNEYETMIHDVQTDRDRVLTLLNSTKVALERSFEEGKRLQSEVERLQNEEVTVGGKTYSLSQVAEITGINKSTLNARLAKVKES